MNDKKEKLIQRMNDLKTQQTKLIKEKAANPMQIMKKNEKIMKELNLIAEELKKF